MALLGANVTKGCLPSAGLLGVLLFEPARQGGEIIEERRRIHLSRAGQFFQSIGPRFARAHFKKGLESLAGFFVSVDRALVKWPFVSGGITHCLVELKL